MATHPCILAWRNLCTEEPGGLQSLESQSQTRLRLALCILEKISVSLICDFSQSLDFFETELDHVGPS